MERFSSLKHVPSVTRQLLRDRFARFLPPQSGTAAHTNEGVTLADEMLLRLLLNLHVDFERDIGRVRATYQAALPPNSNESSLEDLVKVGWIRVVWGRISTPFEVAHAARSAAGTMTALAAVLAKQHHEHFTVMEPARSSADLVTVATAVNQGNLEPQNIGCQSPEWVAARLWDRPLTELTDPSKALRVWVDRWKQLRCPSLVPGRAWGDAAANTFRETALKLLESEASLVGWVEMRVRIIQQLALTKNQPTSAFEDYIPQVPATLVDRARWLDDHRIERSLMGSLEACGDIFGPATLLLAEVEAEDYAPAPHMIAGRVFTLAIERPELLFRILISIRGSPVLLADLLLYPPTSALACLLIGRWQSNPGAWDRELCTRDNQTTKAIAFADAVSVMAHFLKQGSLPPEEAASLLDWFHEIAGSGSTGVLGAGESMLAALRGELASQSSETLQKMVAALTKSMPQSGLGSSDFAAALDIIEAGQLAGVIDPTPLVTAYTESIARGAYALSASRVSSGGAVSLFELAMRAHPDLREKFLSPVSIKARLAAAAAADENVYTVMDDLARSIRAHVRVLTRAAVGSVSGELDELMGALIVGVRAGALKHDEKGRIAAFSARYESPPFRGPHDRPIASDFGAALTALANPHREQLLSAILEIDEPLVLAQLLSFAPHSVRDRLEQRIAELTPSEAGVISSLTEAQARIEGLLSAGLADAAEQFINEERDLKPLGAVPGRLLERLRTTLRLYLLRHDWAAIANTVPPPELSPGEQPSAIETINFYKAVAALLNSNGDRHAAERIFAQLQHSRPDVLAYAANLFSVRTTLLLKGDLFGQLRGADLVRGRQVLADAEQMLLHVRTAGDSELEIFNRNKALLLLGLNQPEQAHELLTTLNANGLNDNAAAYSAVALARMGRVVEAISILDQAEQELGATEVLRAARAHIKSGAPFLAAADLSSEDDPVPRIKNALFDLLQMDHMRQAEVLKPRPEPFDTLVIEHVRAATASVTSLVPMMKGVDFTSCEDDLTALTRELLVARFQFLGWSVPDQSKGGFTAKGNPGERDLLLQKDSTTLAVIEAVVSRASIPKQDLTFHFQKLFGYSTCCLFFHLTYAYGENVASVLDHLKSTAETDAPTGFKYLKREDINFTDSRPTGFIARYAGQSGEIKVVFLVLDLSQSPQREAAKTAAKKSSSKQGHGPVKDAES